LGGDSEYISNVNVGVSDNPGIGPYNGIITPALDAELGDTRMGVRINWGAPPDPCDDTVEGEVEDYAVSVTDIP
jgi:hypothetical protein